MASRLNTATGSNPFYKPTTAPSYGAANEFPPAPKPVTPMTLNPNTKPGTVTKVNTPKTSTPRTSTPSSSGGGGGGFNWYDQDFSKYDGAPMTGTSTPQAPSTPSAPA